MSRSVAVGHALCDSLRFPDLQLFPVSIICFPSSRFLDHPLGTIQCSYSHAERSHEACVTAQLVPCWYQRRSDGWGNCQRYASCGALYYLLSDRSVCEPIRYHSQTCRLKPLIRLHIDAFQFKSVSIRGQPRCWNPLIGYASSCPIPWNFSARGILWRT